MDLGAGSCGKMKSKPVLSWLIPLVGILALVAAGVGLFGRAGVSLSPSQPSTARQQRCTGRGYIEMARCSLERGSGARTR